MGKAIVPISFLPPRRQKMKANSLLVLFHLKFSFNPIIKINFLQAMLCFIFNSCSLFLFPLWSLALFWWTVCAFVCGLSGVRWGSAFIEIEGGVSKVSQVYSLLTNLKLKSGNEWKHRPGKAESLSYLGHPGRAFWKGPYGWGGLAPCLFV